MKDDRPVAGCTTPETQAGGSPYHILAASNLADERTRVLKHGDTIAVFDHYGDFKPGGLGEEGLYHEGTRYLSRLLLELEGARPVFLSSTIRDENDQLAVSLTNPDLLRDGAVRVPLGTLHLALKKFLWRGVCYQLLRVKNYGLVPVEASLRLHFAADFADIYEIRGMKRKARGDDLRPEVGNNRVVLGYRGLDGVVRRTLLELTPAPSVLRASGARLDLALEPRQEAVFTLTVGCERRPAAPRLLSFDEARTEAEADLERYSAWAGHLHTSNGQINAWVNRAVSDLHMLTTELPTGPYPQYEPACRGFNTPFGRDGLVTALECLWLRPVQLARRGVLSYLASTQATAVVPEEDAEPGKILHEGAMGVRWRSLKEMPFGPLLTATRRRDAAVRPAGGGVLRANRGSGIRRSPVAARRGRPGLDRPFRRSRRGRLCGISAPVRRRPDAPGMERTPTTPCVSRGRLAGRSALSPCVRSRSYVYAARRQAGRGPGRCPPAAESGPTP